MLLGSPVTSKYYFKINDYFPFEGDFVCIKKTCKMINTKKITMYFIEPFPILEMMVDGMNSQLMLLNSTIAPKLLLKLKKSSRTTSRPSLLVRTLSMAEFMVKILPLCVSIIKMESVDDNEKIKKRME